MTRDDAIHDLALDLATVRCYARHGPTCDGGHDDFFAHYESKLRALVQPDPIGDAVRAAFPAPPTPDAVEVPPTHGMVSVTALSLANDIIASTTADRDRLRAELENWRFAAASNHEAMVCAQSVAADAQAEIERLRYRLTHAGVCELGADNVNVASYCREWEQRAEKAEAKLERVKADARAASMRLRCGLGARQGSETFRIANEVADIIDRALADLDAAKRHKIRRAR